MRIGAFRAGRFVAVLSVLSALWPVAAAAEPGTGPRGSVDQTFTTTRPNAPTGLGFDSSFHAVGDEQGNPPYLERMVVHPPAGMRYDTSVPDQCTATDAELRLRGPNACPQGSLLGDGTTTGLFMFPVADNLSDQFVFHEFWHILHVFNNANEQIVLVEAEGYEVVRGRFRADGAIDWQLPTCFPAPPTGCADDYIIQLTNSTFLPPYTEESADGLRSYATTPPECPRGGFWRTTVELTWSDGSFDSLVTTQPCRADRTLTLHANRGKVETGRKVRLSGQIDAPQNEAGCEQNQTVELQRKAKRAPHTAFATFKTVQTDQTGKFADKVKVRKTYFYRAVVQETGTCDHESSNTQKVRVQKKKAAQEA